MKRVLTSMVLALAICSFSLPAQADVSRVGSWGNRPFRKLAKQFNGATETFTTSDPSPAGAALTLTSATGITGSTGTVAVTLKAGFAPPNVLTMYFWQIDSVTPANSCWVRLGPAAANYSVSVDTNYASVVFTIPPGTPFILRSSVAITGDVYIDSRAASENANSAAGF